MNPNGNKMMAKKMPRKVKESSRTPTLWREERGTHVRALGRATPTEALLSSAPHTRGDRDREHVWPQCLSDRVPSRLCPQQLTHPAVTRAGHAGGGPRLLPPLLQNPLKGGGSYRKESSHLDKKIHFPCYLPWYLLRYKREQEANASFCKNPRSRKRNHFRVFPHC